MFWRIVEGGLAPTIRDVRDGMTVPELVEAHMVLDRREALDQALMPPMPKT